MIVIHGDNSVASRNRLLDIKNKAGLEGKTVITFDGSQMSKAELLSAVSTLSLLGDNKIIIIENIFSRRQGNEKKSIIDYLLANPRLDIVVWESKNQSTQLKNLPVHLIERYDLPPYIYRFLENFQLNTLQKAIQQTSPELVLTLLSNHLHNLMLVKYSCGNFPAWKKQKLQKQAQSFSHQQLICLHQRLLDLDFAQKNSQLPYDLTTALEVWLLSH